MNIVITAATKMEWGRIKDNIDSKYVNGHSELKVLFHESGVGILATAFSISKLVFETKPDLIIQVGIAGSFDKNLRLGSVVIVKNEYLGDTGVEEDGLFKDVFDLKLEDKNGFPFNEKSLSNRWLEKYNLLELPSVSGVTVNEVTTREDRAQQLTDEYKTSIETMEGAAMHYVCLQTATPFIQMRGISNYVGERNKANWQIQSSLTNLQHTVLTYLDRLYKMVQVQDL